MNKKSIYKATYGKIEEMNRYERDMSIAQDRFENPDNDPMSGETEDFQIAEAVDFLTEYFMDEAEKLGYDNINDLAVEEYGISIDLPEPGQALIEDMIPNYLRGDLT